MHAASFMSIGASDLNGGNTTTTTHARSTAGIPSTCMAACAGRKLAYLALEAPGGALKGGTTADEALGALHASCCCMHRTAQSMPVLLYSPGSECPIHRPVLPLA